MSSVKWRIILQSNSQLSDQDIKRILWKIRQILLIFFKILTEMYHIRYYSYAKIYRFLFNFYFKDGRMYKFYKIYLLIFVFTKQAPGSVLKEVIPVHARQTLCETSHLILFCFTFINAPGGPLSALISTKFCTHFSSPPCVINNHHNPFIIQDTIF
jgi:hypothetical protein